MNFRPDESYEADFDAIIAAAEQETPLQRASREVTEQQETP
jgi:hypothetical protein